MSLFILRVFTTFVCYEYLQYWVKKEEKKYIVYGDATCI